MPWGVVSGGYASRTDKVTSGATLQINPVLLANRRYRFSWWAMLNNTTGANQFPVVSIQDFSAVIRAEWWPAATASMATATFLPASGEFSFSSSSTGTLPWNLACASGVGCGGNGANEIAWFMCEDVGPTGAPV
jgi:hypothetical protein